MLFIAGKQTQALGFDGPTCEDSFLRVRLAEHMIDDESLILPVQLDGLRPGLEHIPCRQGRTTWVGFDRTSGEALPGKGGGGGSQRLTDVSFGR